MADTNLYTQRDKNLKFIPIQEDIDSIDINAARFKKDGIVQPDGTIEFISDGNNDVGQDGNYRKKMVGGKLQTQKLITGVWTPLEEI